MGWFSLLFFVVGLVLTYVFWLRPLLRVRPELKVLYDQTDSFWGALGIRLNNAKSKIAAVLLMVASALVQLHDFILPAATSVDWAPITTSLPTWVWPVGSFAVATLFYVLREYTEKSHARETAAVAAGASAVAAVAIAAETSTPTEAAQVAVDINDLHTFPRAV